MTGINEITRRLLSKKNQTNKQTKLIAETYQIVKQR